MHPLLKSHILFYSNGLAIYHGLSNNGQVKVNNGRLAAILNLDKLIFFKMHPLLKPYNLPDIRPNEVNNADCRPF